MLRALFGMDPKEDATRLIEAGAVVLDVRSPAEFAGGHVQGSINIPVGDLLRNLHRVPKGKPVITCCASGLRSASAAHTLRDHGIDAHNGGSWTTLQAAIERP